LTREIVRDCFEIWNCVSIVLFLELGTLGENTIVN
jgi:hypothetical protein